MLRINPAETPMPKMHQYILGSISPRPIAFASTMDAEGNPNLSPFSFFNAVGSNPPTVIFSPARSGRDNTTKNTLDNVEATGEVVINIVNYAIVQQMSLASSPFPKGVNEFIKTGLTPITSEMVKPFRVKESIVQMECKVKDIYYTGKTGGAGNIIISEILLMHINEDIFDENGRMDPRKMDLVARMGGDYYCRVIPESLFLLPQPKDTCGIGVDVLPFSVRNSKILSGNDLGQLGSLFEYPEKVEVEKIKSSVPSNASEEEIHQIAKNKLSQNETKEALKILLLKEYNLI